MQQEKKITRVLLKEYIATLKSPCSKSEKTEKRNKRKKEKKANHACRKLNLVLKYCS